MINTATWRNMYIVNGESTFSLYSYEIFNDTQVQSLTNDLSDVLKAAIIATPEPDPFPTTIVVTSVATIVVVGLGIFAYFKKYRKK